jgi:iron complex outermembrane receptor protein
VRRETVSSALYFGDARTRDGMLARANANLEWRVQPDLLVQGGAMLEHHYYAGWQLSPRVAANYEFAPGHTLRAGVSQAYRTPTFLEQDGFYVYRSTTGLPVDIIGVAPNELASERIRSHELAYVGHYKPWMLQVDARLFRDRVTDYIGTIRTCLPPGSELVPMPPCNLPAVGHARETVNGGAADIRGGELQLNWQPLQTVRLTAHYARVFVSGDATLGAIVRDIDESAPRNSYGLLARYSAGNGWVLSSGVYRSDSMAWLGDGDVTSRFTRIDARIARQWNWQGHPVEAALVGQSLGGDYSEFRKENVFGRRLYGSLALSW